MSKVKPVKTTAIYINDIPASLKQNFDLAVTISGKKQKKVFLELMVDYVKAREKEINYIKKQRAIRAGENE